jgi:hypothetical protein
MTPMDSRSDSAQPKLVTRRGMIIDLVLTAIFFVIMSQFLRSNVMDEREAVVTFFAAYTALCVSGVFWLALQLFRAVFADPNHDRAKA